MINIENLEAVLTDLGFSSKDDVFTKKFESYDCLLQVDFKQETIIYPEKKGLKINARQTCNFSAKENFVVLECVNRLLEKGYNPAHIELEPTWKVGHGASGGRADILVKDNKGKSLLIIECKNAGSEFTKHWNETLENGSQLFGYAQQERDALFLCLYASDFIDEKVQPNYRLIKIKDNEQYLEDNPKLDSFKNAKVRDDLYEVWNNTYQKDYTTKGLFEEDIQAYDIGKKNYTIADLSLIDSSTTQSTHHKFATILRKYNVSGRENAFDKLVNLFLCKIVDEKNNPKDLQFYWKGTAYDTAFELQDRLQKLYQIGMKEFLKEEVTYIDNQQIHNAFRFFKNDPDATRDTIKGYFKQLKFFTNNDFAFIDVHNERLFYENAEVLIDIVRLFQDTKIKSDSKNQFLGDMFENFLDSGVKQSEGQFFTPMPITRFIIQSLPLEQIINESPQVPKAIDYACGSGHFLNELASQMRPFIDENKAVSLEKYHKAIHGIEKEYRLSKVAKVSAFMYGQDNIDITYADALAKSDKFKNSDYQILVANPPYSVKGFLGTLDQDSKDSFELIKTLDSKQIATNNSIECFFIEKAKQMLGSNGVAAIIVPSSILSNGDSTYVGTRSILLKYFDIIAIAEFGSGTFGKTGTNTVTLFLRRKGNEPEQAVHYKNRVDSWFTNNDTDKQKTFADEHFIASYCQHVDIELDDYKSLLQGKPNENLLKYEMFTEYQEAFDNLTAIKNKKKQTAFTKLPKEKKQKELDILFLNYLLETEKEKLYYFVLASQNITDVVIVKSPSDNKANKKFLGYEWSSAKGNEGIKLYKDVNDKHLTPLYHEDDRNDEDKISVIIKNAFNNKPLSIKPELESFVSISPLVDMLDFKRTDFDRQISLSSKKKLSIQSKWNIEKLGDIADFLNGLWTGKKPPFMKVNVLRNTNFTKNGELDYSNVAELDVEIKQFEKRQLQKGDIIIEKSGGSATQAVGRVVYFDKKNENYSYSNFTSRMRVTKNNINPEYIFLFLNYFYQLGYTFDMQNGTSGIKNLNFDLYKKIRIPVPPLDIQQKIVDECQTIDMEKEKAEEAINHANKFIVNIVSENRKHPNKRLSEICSLQAGKFVSADDINDDINDENFPCYGGNGLRGYTKTFTHEGTNSLIGRQGALCGNINLASGKFHATEHAVVVTTKKDVDTMWLYYQLKSMNLNQYATGVAQPGLSVKNITPLEVPLPSFKAQKAIVKKIEVQEKIISKANKVIESIAERKQAVLTNYL